jgi:hypothetical protein
VPRVVLVLPRVHTLARLPAPVMPVRS